MRKWIRNLAALREASPSAKVLSHKHRVLPSLPGEDDSTDTDESWSSARQHGGPVAPEPASTVPEGVDGSCAPDTEALHGAQELLSLGAGG